ncbi:MAG: peptidase MA domain-containing protein [Dehalococcoidia bacterium]|nr:peptidase MA domain-containing protein [Dehalococcoidia bacterium]
MIRQITIILLLLICLTPASVSAASDIRLLDSSTEADFPNLLTFRVKAASADTITRIRLRYEVDKKVYAPTFAEAWPELQPAHNVETTWSWDMRKGILPPGARVTYWWVIEDASGNRLTTPKKVISFDDTRHQWQKVSDQNINIYWYRGSRSFAGELLKAATDAKERLERDTGVTLEQPVHIYIYANYSDLRDSIVSPDEWTGGVAYRGFTIISIGISTNNLAWGKKAVAHELGHLMTQQVTVSPYGETRPYWLDEGLAMHAEGEQSEVDREELRSSIEDGRIATLQSLTSPFPADSQQAYFAYAQSQSVTEYLIKNHGRDNIRRLLVLLNDGYSMDDALTTVYGFDLSGLDDAWLEYMTAAPQDNTVPGEVLLQRTEPYHIHSLSPVLCTAFGGGA